MPTIRETALSALHDVLKAAALASPHLPDDVPRNRNLRDLFGSVTGARGAYLQLVDDDPRVIDDYLGASDATQEIEHLGIVEFIVIEADEATRETAFDNGLQAIADALHAARSNPAWDDLQILEPSFMNLSTGPQPDVKAVRVPVALLVEALSSIH